MFINCTIDAQQQDADILHATCTDAANLMTGAGDDTGEVENADLMRLLDRFELQPGDEAYCADELLGEVNPATVFPWSSKI